MAKSTSDVFSAEEKAAMRAMIKERKASDDRAAGEAAAQAAIAEMPGPDRLLGERVRAIVKAAAPTLAARTWYGMPAYANEAGKVICFFQAASKFKVRYATLGFQHDASLDDGAMWPVAYALVELTPEVEARITDLVRRAVG